MYIQKYVYLPVLKNTRERLGLCRDYCHKTLFFLRINLLQKFIVPFSNIREGHFRYSSILYYYYSLFYFSRLGFSVYPWLSSNLVHRPGWSSDLPPSASLVLGLKSCTTTTTTQINLYSYILFCFHLL